MSNGLLGGLSNAVNTGLNAYVQEKKYQDQKTQEAQANKLKNLGLIVEARKSGLLPTFTDETPTRVLPEGEYESVVNETPEQPKALWDREISGFKTDPNYVDNKKLLETLGVREKLLNIDKSEFEKSQRGKGKQISEQTSAGLAFTGPALSQLNSIREFIKKNKDNFGANLSGALSKLRTEAGYPNAKEAEYESLRQTFAKMLASLLEDGRKVTVEDERRALRLVPGFINSYESAMSMLDGIEKLMVLKNKGTLGALKASGYDVEQIMQMSKDEIEKLSKNRNDVKKSKPVNNGVIQRNGKKFALDPSSGQYREIE